MNESRNRSIKDLSSRTLTSVAPGGCRQPTITSYIAMNSENTACGFMQCRMQFGRAPVVTSSCFKHTGGRSAMHRVNMLAKTQPEIGRQKLPNVNTTKTCSNSTFVAYTCRPTSASPSPWILNRRRSLCKHLSTFLSLCCVTLYWRYWRYRRYQVFRESI